MAVEFVDERGTIIDPDAKGRIHFEGETYVRVSKKLSVAPFIWFLIVLVAFSAGGILGMQFARDDYEKAGCNLDPYGTFQEIGN